MEVRPPSWPRGRIVRSIGGSDQEGWGPGPDKRGDRGRRRTVGQIERGGGDGGEPVRGPPGRPSKSRSRGRPMGGRSRRGGGVVSQPKENGSGAVGPSPSTGIEPRLRLSPPDQPLELAPAGPDPTPELARHRIMLFAVDPAPERRALQRNGLLPIRSGSSVRTVAIRGDLDRHLPEPTLALYRCP